MEKVNALIEGPPSPLACPVTGVRAQVDGFTTTPRKAPLGAVSAASTEGASSPLARPVTGVHAQVDGFTATPRKAPLEAISGASSEVSSAHQSLDLDADFPPWCASCAQCRWWTGALCLQEHLGFRECPEYAVSFVQHAVAQDRVTGRGVLIPLKKGQTMEDLRLELAAQGRTPAPHFEGGWDVLNS